MERSLTRTLALKLRISVSRVYRRYGATLQTDQGPCVGLQVTVERDGGRRPLVARWGGITLARDTEGSPRRQALAHLWTPDGARTAPPGECLRAVRLAGEHRGASRSRSEGPAAQGTCCSALLGRDHGGASAQDAGNVPCLPRRHSRWTSRYGGLMRRLRRTLESWVLRKAHARFGEGCALQAR